MSTEQNTIATMVRAFAEIIERQVLRFENQGAEYERKLTEHRASFGARTSADAKIIEGLRAAADAKIIEGLRAAADEQVLSAYKVAYVFRCAGETPVQAAQRVVKERDSLLTQVQDQRAEIERLTTQMADQELSVVGIVNERNDAWERCDALRAEVADLRGIFDMVHASLGIKQGDHIGKAIEALKAQTPTRSHPVKVGEWVKRTSEPYPGVPVGTMKQVADAAKKHYNLKDSHGWSFEYCEPCDPPADHDTPAGKDAAESAVKREPKPGDTVRLVRFPTPKECREWSDEFGKIGELATVMSDDDEPCPFCVSVVRSEGCMNWPLSCVEVVKGGDK